MLARTAENIYWLGRYLERTENLARLINTTTELMLDLPMATPLRWYSLITVMGFEESYRARYADSDESSVMQFLISDRENVGSIIRTVAAARENARVVRNLLPREAWEQINSLYHQARDDLPQAHLRRHRDAFLRRLLISCSTIHGILISTMSRNLPYNFERIGELLERIDMTSRIIDIRVTELMPRDTAAWPGYAAVGWVGLLNSLGGYEMYRQGGNMQFERPNVVRFLVEDPGFPRSIRCCLDNISRSLGFMPRSEGLRTRISRLAGELEQDSLPTLSTLALHHSLDGLQKKLMEFDQELSAAYFNNPCITDQSPDGQ